MNMKMSYRVVAADTPEDLEDQVNDLLDDCWELYGNIVVTVNSVTGEEMFVQTLVVRD